MEIDCSMVSSRPSTPEVDREARTIAGMTSTEDTRHTGRGAETISVPRADGEAMQAELRQFRRRQGDAEALRLMRSDNLDDPTASVYTRDELADRWGPNS